MLTRRTFLLAPPAASLARLVHAQSAESGKMLLAIHQNTSRAAGYRGSLEGWARAGIRYVELNDGLLDAKDAADPILELLDRAFRARHLVLGLREELDRERHALLRAPRAPPREAHC